MKKILLVLFVLMLFIGVGKANCQSIPPYAITGGGGFGTSTNYNLFSLMGSYSTPDFSESIGYLHFDDFFSTTHYLSPIHPRVGTIGTEMTLRGTGFGIKKGKVLLEKIVDESPKTLSLKVIHWGDDSIRVQLQKIPSAGPGVYDVRIIPKDKGLSESIWESGFTVRDLPNIYSIEGEDSPGAVRIAKGRFLGTKKGKVYLEFTEGNIPKGQSCKVSYWKMHPSTGESEVEFIMPKKLPVVEYGIGVYRSGVTPDYAKPCPDYCDCPVGSPCNCPFHCDPTIYCRPATKDRCDPGGGE